MKNTRNTLPGRWGAKRFPLWDRVVGEMQGNDLARQIREGTPYPVKGLWAHGLNYRMFNGDRELEQALKQLDFFVDIDLFLTDSAKLADIVLPLLLLLRAQRVQSIRRRLRPVDRTGDRPLGQSRPDDEIIVELARRLELDDELLCSGSEACVRYMLRDTPHRRGRTEGPLSIPQKLEGVKTIPVGEHGFGTPTGKFELWSTVIEQIPGLDPLPTWRDSVDAVDPARYPFRLVAGARLPNALHSRLHDVPWLRSLRPQPTADLNDGDAQALGISQGGRHRIDHQCRNHHRGRQPHPDGQTGNGIPLPRISGGRCQLHCPPGLTIRIPAFPATACAALCQKGGGGAMRLLFGFDAEKCTACGACAIACMDQNDIDVEAGQRPYRRVLIRETQAGRRYLSLACLHCADAPCIPACPVNCLYRDDKTGLVRYDNTACVGCRACQAPVPTMRSPSAPLEPSGPERRWRNAMAAWSGWRRGSPRLRARLSHRRPDLALGRRHANARCLCPPRGGLPHLKHTAPGRNSLPPGR